MELKPLWFFMVLAVLSIPSLAQAQDSTTRSQTPPCAPAEKCIEAGQDTEAGTAPAPVAKSKPHTRKKSPAKTTKKRTAKKAPQSAAEPVPAGPVRETTGKRPPAQASEIDPACTRLYAPNYCIGGARPKSVPGTVQKATPVRAAPSSAAAAAPDETGIESPFAESAAPARDSGSTDVEPDLLSKEALFGLPETEGASRTDAKGIEWRGFVQNETAYTYDDPAHWSRGVVRTQVRAQGGEGGFKWKATVRVDVDPVYYGTDFYPQPVREDQRLDFFLRETYVDTSVGGLELRLGKQNIIWGEMVGLFFADVVSARDQRDFILPDFEIIRIPQWAARAEYFGEKSHAELIWLPYPEIDKIGKPGAEFFPFQIPAPPGFNQQFNDERRPDHDLKNSNYGARASTLRYGWDLSAFYYRSTDVSPTFYRDLTLSPTPTLVYTPRHDRIWQAGGTLAKDFGSVVAKAETIYASGRKFNVTRLTEPTGVVPQDTLDYVLGLDFALPRETRLNLQYFERLFFHHDPDLLLQDRRESGVSLLLSGKIGANLEPEFLIIQSVNRNDRLMRPKLAWIPEKNWRVTFGVDIFSGPITGLFGRFQDRDRAYVELRYDF